MGGVEARGGAANWAVSVAGAPRLEARLVAARAAARAVATAAATARAAAEAVEAAAEAVALRAAEIVVAMAAVVERPRKTRRGRDGSQ